MNDPDSASIIRGMHPPGAVLGAKPDPVRGGRTRVRAPGACGRSCRFMRLLMVSLLTISTACGAGTPPGRGGPRAAVAEPSPGEGASSPAHEPPADEPTADEPAASPSPDETGSVPAGAEEPDRYPARVVLEPPGEEPVEVRVELALTEPQRARGLMHRRHLPDDAGMLFVFDRMDHLSFWMENTLIPLDMVFIDDAMRVVGVVESAEPLTRDAREVDGESRYVLEVNGGFAGRHGIAAGTPVRFENVPSADADGNEEMER